MGETDPFQSGCLITLAQLSQPVLLLHSQIGMFFHLGLVQAVDDGVFPLLDEDSLDLFHHRDELSGNICRHLKMGICAHVYLFRIRKPNLPNCHAAILV